MKAQKLPVLCLLYHFRTQVMCLVHVILQFITALQKLQKAELALCGKVLQLSYGLNILCTWQRMTKEYSFLEITAGTDCDTAQNQG